MSETKLLPCPFCGGEAKIATYDWGYSIKEYWVYCSCGCETKKFHSKEQAIEAWNTRKPIDDIVAELEKDTTCRFRLEGYIPKSKAIDIVRNAGKGGSE